jgi:hypothetical protein
METGCFHYQLPLLSDHPSYKTVSPWALDQIFVIFEFKRSLRKTNRRYSAANFFDSGVKLVVTHTHIQHIRKFG